MCVCVRDLSILFPSVWPERLGSSKYCSFQYTFTNREFQIKCFYLFSGFKCVLSKTAEQPFSTSHSWDIAVVLVYVNRQSPSSNFSTQSATWDLGFLLGGTCLLLSVPVTTLSCVSGLMSHFPESKWGSPEPETEPPLPELCRWLENQRDVHSVPRAANWGNTPSSEATLPVIRTKWREPVHGAQWDTSVLGCPWPGPLHILERPRKHTLFFWELHRAGQCQAASQGSWEPGNNVCVH